MVVYFENIPAICLSNCAWLSIFNNRLNVLGLQDDNFNTHRIKTIMSDNNTGLDLTLHFARQVTLIKGIIFIEMHVNIVVDISIIELSNVFRTLTSKRRLFLNHHWLLWRWDHSNVYWVALHKATRSKRNFKTRCYILSTCHIQSENNVWRWKTHVPLRENSHDATRSRGTVEESRLGKYALGRPTRSVRSRYTVSRHLTNGRYALDKRSVRSRHTVGTQ